MRLRHIEVFHAVYTCGSITRAASLLNVSQPSVSKVLAHAEQQLGFLLFDRVKGKLNPTPEAERLYEHVAVLFDDISAVRRVASNLRNSAKGRIRIATTPALGIELVPSIVSAYMVENPEVFFELETLHYAEIASALGESRIDLALAFDPPNVPGIACQPVAQGEFVIIAPPNIDLGSHDTRSLNDISGFPFIKLNVRGPLGQLLDAQFEASEAVLNVVATAETYHIAKSLVTQGLGVAIVDEITASSGKGEGFRTIKLEPTLNFKISILKADNVPPSRVCSKFVEYLEQHVKNLYPMPA